MSNLNDAVEAIEAYLGTNASQTTPTGANRVLRSTSATASTWGSLVLTTDVTGTLPVANGGTGATTFTANGVLYGNGTSAIQVTAQGGTNTILTANAGAPSWSATPTINTSVTVPVVIGGTGTTSTLTLRSTSGVGAAGADIIFQVGNNGATEAMRILNSGFVGIGVAAPAVKLEVSSGIIRATNAAGAITQIGGWGTTLDPGVISSDQANFKFVNSGGSALPINTQGILLGASYGDTPGAGEILTSAATDLIIKPANAEKVRVKSTGEVGIGTASPTNILSLGGNSAQKFWMERHTTTNTAGNTLTVEAGGATSGATDKNGGDLYLKSGIATGTGSSNIYLQTHPAGSTGTTDTTATTAITILGSGFVGIGTSPSATLHVSNATTGATAEIARIMNTGAQLGRGIRIRGSTNGFIGIEGVITATLAADSLILNIGGGNVGIGGDVFGTSADKVLSIKTGTAPTTGPADTVQFYSSDDAAGHTIPSFFCEGTNVLATGQADSTSSVRVKMRINGTVVTLLAI